MKIAQAITVRMEGATQGSGILVRREGNKYTVLTAWHVVSGQAQGEELDIYTSDGKRHHADEGSVKRLGKADMATVSFLSTTQYETAAIADSAPLRRGDDVFIAGFSIEDRARLTFSPAILLAYATVGIDQGYQLMYTHRAGHGTSPGMSGGPIINKKGLLMGMHGRGEVYQAALEVRGDIEKTNRNMGVPIKYFTLPETSENMEALTPSTYEDYLVMAASILDHRGAEFSTKSQLEKVLEFIKPIKPIFIRDEILQIGRQALWQLGRNKEAIKVIDASPPSFESMHDKALALYDLGKKKEACNALRDAVRLFPKNGTKALPGLPYYYMFLKGMPRFRSCFVLQQDGGFVLDPSLPIYYPPW